jgi:protoheme IX farnesyltransferase
MVVWQMPHFYAIAIFRAKEYKSAKIPVLSVVHGDKITCYFMLVYSLLFIALIILLYRSEHLGLAYLVVMLIVSIGWLIVNIYGLFVSSLKQWARKSFFASLVVLLVMSLMVAIR